ncbi:MAG: FlgD immunoglobulin-like domain containing protein [Fibrobacterota bacterium]
MNTGRVVNRFSSFLTIILTAALAVPLFAEAGLFTGTRTEVISALESTSWNVIEIDQSGTISGTEPVYTVSTQVKSIYDSKTGDSIFAVLSTSPLDTFLVAFDGDSNSVGTYFDGTNTYVLVVPLDAVSSDGPCQGYFDAVPIWDPQSYAVRVEVECLPFESQMVYCYFWKDSIEDWSEIGSFDPANTSSFDFLHWDTSPDSNYSYMLVAESIGATQFDTMYTDYIPSASTSENLPFYTGKQDSLLAKFDSTDGFIVLKDPYASIAGNEDKFYSYSNFRTASFQGADTLVDSVYMIDDDTGSSYVVLGDTVYPFIHYDGQSGEELILVFDTSGSSSLCGPFTLYSYYDDMEGGLLLNVDCPPSGTEYFDFYRSTDMGNTWIPAAENYTTPSFIDFQTGSSDSVHYKVIAESGSGVLLDSAFAIYQGNSGPVTGNMPFFSGDSAVISSAVSQTGQIAFYNPGGDTNMTSVSADLPIYVENLYWNETDYLVWAVKFEWGPDTLSAFVLADPSDSTNIQFYNNGVLCEVFNSGLCEGFFDASAYPDKGTNEIMIHINCYPFTDMAEMEYFHFDGTSYTSFNTQTGGAPYPDVPYYAGDLSEQHEFQIVARDSAFFLSDTLYLSYSPPSMVDNDGDCVDSSVDPDDSDPDNPTPGGECGGENTWLPDTTVERLEGEGWIVNTPQEWLDAVMGDTVEIVYSRFSYFYSDSAIYTVDSAGVFSKDSTFDIPGCTAPPEYEDDPYYCRENIFKVDPDNTLMQNNVLKTTDSSFFYIVPENKSRTAVFVSSDKMDGGAAFIISGSNPDAALSINVLPNESVSRELFEEGDAPPPGANYNIRLTGETYGASFVLDRNIPSLVFNWNAPSKTGVYIFRFVFEDLDYGMKAQSVFPVLVRNPLADTSWSARIGTRKYSDDQDALEAVSAGETVFFNPAVIHQKAIGLAGKRDITLNGNGAVFTSIRIYNDFPAPDEIEGLGIINLKGCENIAVKEFVFVGEMNGPYSGVMAAFTKNLTVTGNRFYGISPAFFDSEDEDMLPFMGAVTVIGDNPESSENSSDGPGSEDDEKGPETFFGDMDTISTLYQSKKGSPGFSAFNNIISGCPGGFFLIGADSAVIAYNTVDSSYYGVNAMDTCAYLRSFYNIFSNTKKASVTLTDFGDGISSLLKNPEIMFNLSCTNRPDTLLNPEIDNMVDSMLTAYSSSGYNYRAASAVFSDSGFSPSGESPAVCAAVPLPFSAGGIPAVLRDINGNLRSRAGADLPDLGAVNGTGLPFRVKRLYGAAGLSVNSSSGREYRYSLTGNGKSFSGKYICEGVSRTETTPPVTGYSALFDGTYKVELSIKTPDTLVKAAERTFTVAGLKSRIIGSENDGWQMSGCFSDIDSLKKPVFGYNPLGEYSPELGYYFETRTMKAGRGYWIYGADDRQSISAGLPADSLESAPSESGNTGWGLITSPVPYAFKVPAGANVLRWDNGDYIQSDYIEPWKGYWYQTGGAVDIFASKPSAVLETEAPVIAKLRKLYRNDDNWEISLSAFMNGETDAENFIGIRPDASAGYDPEYDMAEPPAGPASKQLSLYFDGSSYGSSQYKSFRKDIKSAALSTNEWTVVINTGKNTGTLTLQFGAGFNKVMEKRKIFIVEKGNVTEIGKEGLYRTVSKGGTMALTIAVTGDENYASKYALKFELGANRPNPFNPVTSISFTIPVIYNSGGVPMERIKATLNIYDVKGRLVRTLANREIRTGKVYNTEWDGLKNNGLSAASGIYIYRIKAGDKFVKSRKMTLIK